MNSLSPDFPIAALASTCNSPAITCTYRLALKNPESQSASPRLNQRLPGNISEDYITEIKSYLDSGDFFVAEQVNIPTLYSQLWKYSNGPTIADHAFHEFSSLLLATEHEIASQDLWGETSVLLDSFRLASEQLWDCSQSVHCAVF